MRPTGLALGLVLLLGTGCWIERPGPPTVSNGTHSEVMLYQVSESGDEELLWTIEPGLSFEGVLAPGDCTRLELVVRLPDGTELERRPPGFCEGEVWRVNGDPSD